MNGQQPMKVQYRPYSFAGNLPVVAFTGSRRPRNDLFNMNTDDTIRFVHLHNCVEVGLPTAGRGVLYADDRLMEVQEGEAVVIMPFRTHVLREKHNGIRDYLFYDAPAFLQRFVPDSQGLSALYESSGVPSCVILKGDEAALLERRCRDIIAEIQRDQGDGALCARGLLLALIVEISRVIGQAVRQEHGENAALSILPALQYLNANYREAISMSILPELCHLSGTHFRRLFHSIMGCSPLEYTQNMRVNYACQQLLSSDTSILDISMHSGYDSISSFNRQFIKIVGTTPSRWRHEYGLSHSDYLPTAPYAVSTKGPE